MTAEGNDFFFCNSEEVEFMLEEKVCIRELRIASFHRYFKGMACR